MFHFFNRVRPVFRADADTDIREQVNSNIRFIVRYYKKISSESESSNACDKDMYVSALNSKYFTY